MSENTETVPAAEPGSIAEAASAFEAILSGEPEKEEEPQDETPAAEEAPAETTDEGEEPPEDEPEAEAEPDEAEDKDAPEPAPAAAITVEIDGKAVELTKEEVQASYLRQADYTRKTQALADERRQFSAELDEARKANEVYAELLPVLVERLKSEAPKPPEASLIDVDPARYLKERDAYERAMGDYQAAQIENQRMSERSRAQQEAALQAYVQQNAEKLPELIPEWQDVKAYERDRVKVREYLSTRGFSDGEIHQAYDARIIAMAYDAMRWRELKRSKPRADAPLEKAIRTSPPPARPQTSKTRVFVEDKKRLAKTGSVRDAAKVFESLI